MSARASLDLYRLAAPVYDLATLGWSGGAIWRTRAHSLTHARPGVSFFVPGAGTGRLALEAAKRGARTIALDRSPAMLRRARHRVDRHRAKQSPGAPPLELDLQLDLQLGDLDEWEKPPGFHGFDVVVAEHFLNVFRPSAMPTIRERLIALTKPGGLLVIADFTPLRPNAPAPARWAQAIHHVVPLGGCALLTRNAMHPIYDHGADLAERQDVRLEATVDEPSFRIGPRWFRAWTFRKLGGRP